MNMSLTIGERLLICANCGKEKLSPQQTIGRSGERRNSLRISPLQRAGQGQFHLQSVRNEERSLLVDGTVKDCEHRGRQNFPLRYSFPRRHQDQAPTGIISYVAHPARRKNIPFNSHSIVRYNLIFIKFDLKDTVCVVKESNFYNISSMDGKSILETMETLHPLHSIKSAEPPPPVPGANDIWSSPLGSRYASKVSAKSLRKYD